MRSSIFRNATFKLTAIYLTIIMIISLVFSIGLYRISAHEVQRSVRAQGPVDDLLQLRGRGVLEEFIFQREEYVDDAKSRIRNDLIVINLSILLIAGVISYYLAKRTLGPIEAAHEAQSRFTADASHELRTPITAMRIETELALTDDKLTLRKARHQLESNIEELDKLTSLSEGLLQLARLDNNDIQTNSVSIAHAVEQAAENVMSNAHQKSQKIDIEKLPSVHVQANQPAIIQVLVILLDNAIKYSPDGSTIKLTAKKHKNHVSIHIKDSGTGIKASELPHIFARFYRADNSRTKSATSAGYGIGLSIAKSIIDQHNGSIVAKSSPEKGSTFSVNLPL